MPPPHSDYPPLPWGAAARPDPPKDSRACRSSAARKGAEGRHQLASCFCLGRLLGAREVGGARARVQGAEVPRGRPVELDVAAAAVAAVQLVPAVKAGLGRVDDVAVLYQPDVELVSSAWFAGVIGPHDEIDVAVGLVRPRGAADAANADRPAFGVEARCLKYVGRDARPVGVQAAAVVDVLQVPEGRRAARAAAGDAEIRLGAVIDDESAAGHDVAVSICGAACKREGERRDAGSKTGPNCTHDHSSVTEWPRWRTRGPRLRYRRRQDAGRSRRCRPRWPSAR